MTTPSKKVDAWMPLWIGDYLSDTMSMSMEQHGAYLLLLFAYWKNGGPLPDDDQELATITRASCLEHWSSIRPKMLKHFLVVDGTWVHSRADKELKLAGARAAGAAAKAKAAAEARWGKVKPDASSNAPSIPQAMPEQCPSPSPSPNTTTNVVVEEKTPRKRSATPVVDKPMATLEQLEEAGIPAEVAAEFISHKAAMKAPLTARAWRDHQAEAQKAGWTPLQAAEKVLAKNWKGFEAKYVANEPAPGRAAQPTMSYRERDEQAARDRAAEFTGHSTRRVIDITPKNPPLELLL